MVYDIHVTSTLVAYCDLYLSTVTLLVKTCYFLWLTYVFFYNYLFYKGYVDVVYQVFTFVFCYIFSIYSGV
ncbi:hypothetical protein VCHA50P416_120044 [Vibrio chagasii]|nr:hypothetical protein VCHA42P256_120113 [Vibrio chagasii]CAH6921771.1 hypothetical protein VCHA43P272_130042 [Vibrio chagasii]CAH7101278.1 hypothetical protein VCHA34O109_80185 [Vibrio chagasii]CAH7136327.1 hypothetical protein VCHA50P416_120044 [Vibrio chagasii]CAH7297527.1 hypothetical protein VCHA38P215_50153 [Vibrio chagasii]